MLSHISTYDVKIHAFAERKHRNTCLDRTFDEIFRPTSPCAVHQMRAYVNSMQTVYINLG